MAELSAETTAIIDRLKAEGDLIRNSGTNSIRAVKIQLDRFEGVFNTISANSIEQTKILQMQAGLAQEAVEAQRTREQIDELEQEEEKKTRADDDQSRRKTDENINNIGDSISRALSLKKLALAGAGLFVGYNLLKGFIDEKTEGGFSRMEESIANTDWTALSQSINGLGNIAWEDLTTTVNAMSAGLGQVNWQNFANAINIASTRITDFNTWLGETGVGDIVTAVVGGGLVTAGVRGAIQGISSSGGTFASRLARIGPGLAIAVAGLAIAYGDEIGAYIDEQLGLAGENGEGGSGQSIVNIMSAGTTIAALFGFTSPVGIAALAIAGTVSLGLIIRDWVNDFQNQERERFNNQVDAALEAARAAEDPNNLDEETTRALAAARVEAIRRTQLMISEAAVSEAERAAAELDRALGEQTVAPEEGINQLQIRRIMEGIRGGDQEAYQEILNYMIARGESGVGRVGRFFSGQTIEEWARDHIRDMGSTFFENRSGTGDNLFGLDAQGQLDAFNSWGESVRALEQNSFRTGTPGFMDFGAGQYAILHGREAVVPFNTAAGRFLDQYFTENWQPKIADTRRIERVAQGGGSGGAVVINAPTNVSPVVNNVSGGKSVNQISVRSGVGSGFGSADPFGLPSVAN